MKIRSLITSSVFVSVLALTVNGQNEEAVHRRAKIYEPAIISAATRYGLDPHLLWTIAYLESGFNPSAVSYKNGAPCAFGLMQFIPSTARKYSLGNPHDPGRALDAGARYLADLLQRFDGRIDLVLAAYNSGEGTVEAFRDGKRLILSSGRIVNPASIRTGGIPPYEETRRYVNRGMKVLSQITNFSRFTAESPGRSPVESIYSSPAIPKSSHQGNTRVAQSLYVN